MNAVKSSSYFLNLSKDKELAGYKHFKFWQCMDTPRDRQLLEEYLKSKNS